MVVGLAMLLLSPFIVIFMLVYLFLRHAEQFYNHPSTASSRRWSNLSKWIFREFNEVIIFSFYIYLYGECLKFCVMAYFFFCFFFVFCKLTIVTFSLWVMLINAFILVLQVDHLFKHRINSSIMHASDYMKQFPSPIISIIVKFVYFISGGLAAILIFITFFEESLLEGHVIYLYC